MADTLFDSLQDLNVFNVDDPPSVLLCSLGKIVTKEVPKLIKNACRSRIKYGKLVLRLLVPFFGNQETILA